MSYTYLVTTFVEDIPTDSRQIVMIDGTVPNWTPRRGDIHFDHHRRGGAEIQMDEIIKGSFELHPDAIFVTTQLDADACVAVAWLQMLYHEVDLDLEVITKLRAIAYDCDYLMVPPHLSHLANFAAEAVAAMKIQEYKDIPKFHINLTRAEKIKKANKEFERGVERLITAAINKRFWPGESGEAKPYWEAVEKNIYNIMASQLISEYRGCLLFDETRLSSPYVDPRAWIRAAQQLKLNPEFPITLTKKDFCFVRERKTETIIQYVIGTIPFHPRQKEFDYADFYYPLTITDLKKDPERESWTGRETVGGSGWNTSSTLTPQEIIDVIMEVINK